MKPRNEHPRLAVLEPDPEFQPGVDEAPSDIDRRDMMKLLAAGAALATGSLAGCMKKPEERIMPRTAQPPELTPGVPLEYATAMTLDGYATGLLVKTQEARPIKVDGNPDHPASLGATTALHQASILQLYDPYRSKGPVHAGTPASLQGFVLGIARRERSAGLWFLMYPQSSPVLADLMARVRERHPGARFAFYSPLERRNVFEGARRAFGRPLDAQYRFDQADTIVSLDADFAAAMPNSVRWSRDFAARRRPTWPVADMPRLYVAEPRPSPTGSLADHRLPVRPSQVRQLAIALLAAIRGDSLGGAALSAAEKRWATAAAADLTARAGRGLVVAGDRQPSDVHALVHAINDAIGALGTTVILTEPAVIDPVGDGIAELAKAIAAGQVSTLVIVETNPVYSAPPELDIAGLLGRVPETIYAGLDENETSAHCRWLVPLSHYMESWGDARAYDGTISLIQPLIRPMYDSIGLLELVAAFAGDAFPSAHRMLRERYGKGGEAAWSRLLQLGFVPESAAPPVSTKLALAATDIADMVRATGTAPWRTVELSFGESHAVYDGRFAGVSWLQELPKPHDKITWGNAAVIAPATARDLGIDHEEVLRISVGAQRVELPVYVLPGHAERCVSVELGYGRTAGGPIAEGVGVNVYPLYAAVARQGRVSIAGTGRTQPIAATQTHFDQHGREIALAAELEFYRANPDFTAAHRGPQPTWLPEHFENIPAWGMTIDTSLCTGCSACVVACQAENNIPVVGKKGVIKSREMHWLRIDTYREQRGDDVEVVHQPMLCQHCEKAPCEYVCPTYATQHSPDGLNEMTYNRCIGTRFCSNNCPYKVRRFNWFDYTEDTPKTLRLQYNPNVTVRARGVMEKCTYCVQRIRSAEIEARKQNRDIQPNEVTTACQQACPTRAIEFGSLSHARTAMVELRQQPRRYAVLHHLGTRPRTIYLAKITNPSPLLKKS